VSGIRKNLIIGSRAGRVHSLIAKQDLGESGIHRHLSFGVQRLDLVLRTQHKCSLHFHDKILPIESSPLEPQGSR
jgi:hypothetical protein